MLAARDWQEAGVWQALHHRLLDWLGDQGSVDWSRASLDTVSVRAKHGGSTPVLIRLIVASRGASTTC